jgi:S1-C subfamily serine protease
MDTAGSTGFQFQASATQAYAIPINTAEALAQQIVAGSASATVHIGATAFLGVEVEPASAAGFGNSASGALIASVVSGGPASQAGLVPGDTVTSVAGQNITSPTALGTLILSEKPGDSAQVTYLTQSGQQATTTVTFASGPPQ